MVVFSLVRVAHLTRPNGIDCADEKMAYSYKMARTHKKVRYSPSRKENKHTPATAATGVEQAFKFLEGRWKLVILFHLFGGRCFASRILSAPYPRFPRRC